MKDKVLKKSNLLILLSLFNLQLQAGIAFSYFSPDYSLEGLLLEAIKKNNIDQVRLLIEDGADVNAIFDGHKSLLHMAISSHNPQIVHLLVNQEGINIDPVDDWGCTPLVYAVGNEMAQIEIVSLLINKGAKIHHKVPDHLFRVDDLVGTPLEIAHSFGNQQIIALLEQKQAEFERWKARGAWLAAVSVYIRDC